MLYSSTVDDMGKMSLIRSVIKFSLFKTLNDNFEGEISSASSLQDINKKKINSMYWQPMNIIGVVLCGGGGGGGACVHVRMGRTRVILACHNHYTLMHIEVHCIYVYRKKFCSWTIEFRDNSRRSCHYCVRSICTTTGDTKTLSGYRQSILG